MLEVVHVSKKYGKTLAVDDISFSVPDGTVGVLLGPNGAGKSTIIKSIAGLLKFTGGIGIQGIDSKTLEAKKIFAYVPEIPAMYQALTVEEHMEFIKRAYRLDSTDQESQALLERFELWDKKDKMGDELSKGMMQKVSICCALLVKPKVILLDEPMVGLDPKAIKELKEVVLELKNQGCTVLISTHMLDMVQELWDMVFVMDKGKMIASYNRQDAEGMNLDDLFFKVTEHQKEQESQGPDTGREE
jgi:ABC-type multidrug transport system ATPase subunit